MSDSNEPLPNASGESSSSSVALIVAVAIIGSVFIIGALISMYKCFKSCRPKDTCDRQTLPSTVNGIRPSHDPILSAQIVYMHDVVSPRHRNQSTMAHVIVVDDLITVNGMSWAQRMMSGYAVEKSQGSVHETMPVKEAVYVEQPDGKHILAVSHRFRDSMIQVKPEDLGIHPRGHVSMLERSSSVGASMSTIPWNCGITSLFGTHSMHTLDNQDLDMGKKQRKRKRKKGRPVMFDAWCQANLDIKNFRNYTF